MVSVHLSTGPGTREEAAYDPQIADFPCLVGGDAIAYRMHNNFLYFDMQGSSGRHELGIGASLYPFARLHVLRELTVLWKPCFSTAQHNIATLHAHSP